VAGECFLDKDGKTIVLRLAKGTSLSWPNFPPARPQQRHASALN
jgi:hypothetical protein